MTIISAGDTGVADLPEISNSLRFDGTNDYIEKVLSVSGSTTTFVDSIHIKRSDISTARRQSLMYKGNSGGTGNFYYVEFKTDDKLYIFFNSAGTYYFVSDSVFRDPSAWLHLVVAIDTTQAISSNRVKVYLNGSVLTSTSAVYPPQNHAIPSTSGNVNRFSLYSTFWFGGYAANYCCVDGYPTGVNQSNWESINFSALFAYTDPNGQWRSLSKTALQSVVNAGGANSFFLSFDNGTSTTTLGNDASSKGNNWTLTNMVRDGSVDDCWSYDTPTTNFATLNQISQSGHSITNGAQNTQWSATAAGVRGTSYMTTGKWFWEVTQVSIANQTSVGVVRSDTSLTADLVVAGSNAVVYLALNGNKYINGTASAYGATFASNDVISIAADIDANTVEFFKNGVSQGVITGLSLSGNTWSPAVANANNQANQQVAFNFGQRPVASGQWYPDAGGYFRYAPPTGYKALSTKSLSTPSVIKPNEQFDVITWTGTNGAVGRTFTGINFKPDMVWGKVRNTSGSHVIFDSVRGTGKTLRSNVTDAEVTNEPGGYVSSFNSDGFSTTPGSTDNWYWNSSGNTFVAWLLRAGGAAVSNTAGSITSQVSANPAAGFSIVTYTGTGANATVGHGLGVAPKMVIVKPRSTANGWIVGHKNAGSGWNAYLSLQTTSGALGGTPFNNTDPTSSVFSLGATGYGINDSTVTNVAYCFAEVPGFSKIGSYTGNGSTDGPFVWCGFRPKWVMVKRSDASGEWVIFDSTRATYNVNDTVLFAHLSNVEQGPAAGYGIDFTANGFKVRSASINVNGGTLIFMAFAEAPFKYANAR